MDAADIQGIDPALQKAYRDTVFRVDLPEGPFALLIGQASADAAALIAGHGGKGAVFVTAWNPFSLTQSGDWNRAANDRLRQELLAGARLVCPGEGVAGDDAWREASWFALGLDRQQALRLCVRFGQNAVVYVGPDGIPELLFHPDPRRRQHLDESHQTLALPLTDHERVVLDVYLEGESSPHSPEELDAALAALCQWPGLCGDGRVPATIADLLLTGVQSRLPQWRSSRNGEPLVGRKPRRKLATTPVALMPQHLFTINWADTGPGMSWPDAYHVTWVPGWDRHVVTASQDSEETFGCTDQAIGHFAGDVPVEQGVHEVIVRYWRKNYDWNDTGWEELLDSGLLASGAVYDMKWAVWPDVDDEEELDE